MPAGAEGALEAFVSVISGPPGPRPEAIFDNVGGPLLLLWGEDDTVTPLDGPVAKFLKAAVDRRPDTEFVVLPGEAVLYIIIDTRLSSPSRAGAFCNTVLIADFHPSRSLHFLHQSE